MRNASRPAAPAHIAAIDAGSNAIRLSIAAAGSAGEIRVLESERAAVRLGRHAFSKRRIAEETIARAARVFRYFHERMDRHGASAYRAVATAAAREARNRRELLGRIRRKAGINLEVISSGEEARLVCAAVHWALGERLRPRLIFDLGGGSLELNFFRDGALAQRVALPLGTVRLMQTRHFAGAMGKGAAAKLRKRVLKALRAAIPEPPLLRGGFAVGCGGNAEALARIAPGPPMGRIPALSVSRLREKMRRLLPRDIPSRMHTFGLRKDRAEVIGIAAVVIHTLADWAGARKLLVPGVGVREGLLLDLAARRFSASMDREEQGRAAETLAKVRWFARKTDSDLRHADEVARLALGLFDQLGVLRELGPEWRPLLEIGALLHDCGHFVSRKSHHRHGEYLVRNSEAHGLRGWRREFVAALVRYHNCKSEPQPGHPAYAALDGAQRRLARRLSAILRIAERLESEHAQRVAGIEVRIARRRVVFHIRAAEGTRLDLAGLARKAALFRAEFDLKPEFRRASKRGKVA